MAKCYFVDLLKSSNKLWFNLPVFGFLTVILVLIILLSLHLIGQILASRSVTLYKKKEVLGYIIHYKSTGQGDRKVVLIHGAFSNLHCWDKFLKFLSPNTEYISIDLPQMAESISTNKPTPADSIEEIIFEFCKSLELQNPVLVGCSLGGLVAYLSSVKYSAYFSQCVIVSSPFNSRFLLLPIYKASFLAPILNLFVNPVIVSMVYFRIARSGFSWAHVLIILSKFRRVEHFKSSMIYLKLIPRAEALVTIPTKVESFHFIWGNKDHLIKKASFKNFLEQNTSLDYLEMPDATHHPMESHPQIFAKTLQQILDTTSR